MLQYLRNLVERKEIVLAFILVIVVFTALAVPKEARVLRRTAPLARTRPVLPTVGENQDPYLHPHLFRPLLVADVSHDANLETPLLFQKEQGPSPTCPISSS